MDGSSKVRDLTLHRHSENRIADVWSRGREFAHGGPPEAWLQRLTPQSRVWSAVLLLGVVLFGDDVRLLLAVYTVTGCGALAGRLDVGRYLRANLLLVLVFVAPAALLGSLSYFVPGRTAFQLGLLVFTEPGLRAAGRLCLRALDSVAVTTLLIRSLGLRGTVDGFHAAGLPESVTAVLHLTLAHIHLLARSARDMVLGLRARSVHPAGLKAAYQTMAVHGVVLLHKSMTTSRETHAAMLARGFTGRFPRALQKDIRLRFADIGLLAGSILLLSASLLD